MQRQELLSKDLPQNEGPSGVPYASPEILKMLESIDSKMSEISALKVDQFEDGPEGFIDEFEMPEEGVLSKMSYNELLGTVDQYEHRHRRHHMRHGDGAPIQTLPRHGRFRRAIERAHSLGGGPSWKETMSMGIGSAVAAPILNWASSNNPLPNADPNWPFYADLIMLGLSFAGATLLRKHKHARLGFTGGAVYLVGALIDMGMQVAGKQNVGAFSSSVLGF